MAFTKYLSKEVLETYFTNVEVALFTSKPSEDNNDSEVSGGDYERQRITFGKPVSNGKYTEIKNDIEVKFPPASESYTVTHVGVYDKDKNLLDCWEFDSPNEVETSVQLIIPEDNYTIQLD